MSPAKFQREAVGHVRAGSIARHDDGERVRAHFVLGREDGISAVEKRTHTELSSGYTMTIDPTPGEWNGQRYDQAQTKIRYNHVAMLEPGRGRMGRECRLDAAGEEILTIEDEIETMKIKIAGKEYSTEAEAQAAITALEARADAAEAQNKTLTETVARHDAEAAKVKRSALEASAKKVLGETFDASKLSDREVRVAVIKRADSAFDDKDRDDVYVEARFDATLATSSKATAVIDALNSAKPETRADQASAPDRAAEVVKANEETARKRGVAVL
jgi:hypothetical protein